MLGGSLWYVSRRLYGNAGGYLALALYCFSPAMIFNAAGISSFAEMGAVWGAFGAVWTAIAVAHTLYAPREVVLWNWRRTLLLGLSFALAVGNQFSLALLALVALLLMLWVAPVRKRAVLAIWGAACAFALLLMFASYFFHPLLFWRGMMHAGWLQFEPRALAMPFSYPQGLREIFLGSPPLLLALPVALAAYLAWKRARYFGNTAPLAIALLLFLLATSRHSEFSRPRLPSGSAGISLCLCRRRFCRPAGDAPGPLRQSRPVRTADRLRSLEPGPIDALGWIYEV